MFLLRKQTWRWLFKKPLQGVFVMGSPKRGYNWLSVFPISDVLILVLASLTCQDKAPWLIQEPYFVYWSWGMEELRNGVSQIPIQRTTVKFSERLWCQQLHFQRACQLCTRHGGSVSSLYKLGGRVHTCNSIAQEVQENHKFKVICSSIENLRWKRKPNSNGNIAFLNKRDISHFNSCLFLN